MEKKLKSTEEELVSVLRLENIWRFLSETCINERFLHFYPNGWFSVLLASSGGKNIYSPDGLKFAKVTDFHIFENGYMAKSMYWGGSAYDFYSPDGEKINFNVKNIKQFCCQAHVICNISGKLFAYRPDKINHVIHLGCSDEIREVKDSPDGLIAVMYTNSAVIFNEKGDKIEPIKGASSITFLSNGLIIICAEKSYLLDKDFKIVETDVSCNGDYDLFYTHNGKKYDCNTRKVVSEDLIIFSDGSGVVYEKSYVKHTDGSFLLMRCPIRPRVLSKRLIYVRYDGMNLVFDAGIGLDGMLKLVKKMTFEYGDNISQRMFDYLSTIVKFLNGKSFSRKDALLKMLE